MMRGTLQWISCNMATVPMGFMQPVLSSLLCLNRKLISCLFSFLHLVSRMQFGPLQQVISHLLGI